MDRNSTKNKQIQSQNIIIKSRHSEAKQDTREALILAENKKDLPPRYLTEMAMTS